MQYKLAGFLRGMLALAVGALLLATCDKAGSGGGGGGDAGTVNGEDTRPAEPDARPDTEGPATDTAPPGTDTAPDLRPPDLAGAGPEVAADLRGRDATPAPDTAADLRPSDLATKADTVAAGDAAPPNNGSVTGLTVVAANTTVGLDWPRVADATKYRVYWATAPGVSKSASALESTEPAMVHRGLANGTAYYYAVAAVTAAGEGDLSAEATATPGGEWVLEELGAGDFDDVVTGGRVGRLAIKDRIHIVLLGEGYLESELGKLHDLDHPRRYARQRRGPLDRRGLPHRAVPAAPRRLRHLVPAARLGGPPGRGHDRVRRDHHQRRRRHGHGRRRAALLGAGRERAADAFAFPPSSPVVNHVAAFLLYDSARGRAGVSGLTTTLQNPNDRNQRIGAAFGIGHAHEFTHAFASLRDEYLETTNTSRSASETGNTSPTNTCSTLPWAHLIAGAGINTDRRPGRRLRHGRARLPSRAQVPAERHARQRPVLLPADLVGQLSRASPCAVDDRMCNFCREITTYRVFDRTRILPGTSGFATWKSHYRGPFYQRYGFKVPSPVPQTLKCPEDSAARPVFQACVP